MPTEPVKSLLDRDQSVKAAEELISMASPLLREIVNYGTDMFVRSQANAKGERDEHLPILALYLHMLELGDSVEVLVSNSCAYPADILVRSMFEAFLSLEYLVESNHEYKRRAFAWMVAYTHYRLGMYERLDTSSALGQRIQHMVSQDKAPFDLQRLPQEKSFRRRSPT